MDINRYFVFIRYYFFIFWRNEVYVQRFIKMIKTTYSNDNNRVLFQEGTIK